MGQGVGRSACDISSVNIMSYDYFIFTLQREKKSLKDEFDLTDRLHSITAAGHVSENHQWTLPIGIIAIGKKIWLIAWTSHHLASYISIMWMSQYWELKGLSSSNASQFLKPRNNYVCLCQSLHIRLLFVSLAYSSVFVFTESQCHCFFFFEGWGGGLFLEVTVSLKSTASSSLIQHPAWSCPSEILTHWLWLESRSCLFQFLVHILSFVRAILYLIYLLLGWWLHIQSVCQALLRQLFQTR